MARKRIADRHGECAAILHLLVRAPEEFNGVDSDHLVSRILSPWQRSTSLSSSCVAVIISRPLIA